MTGASARLTATGGATAACGTATGMTGGAALPFWRGLAVSTALEREHAQPIAAAVEWRCDGVYCGRANSSQRKLGWRAGVQLTVKMDCCSKQVSGRSLDEVGSDSTLCTMRHARLICCDVVRRSSDR